MKLTYYVPIFSWGPDPDSVYENRSGVVMYSSLQDLQGFEPDAIAYYQVEGEMPTEHEWYQELTERAVHGKP